MNRLKEYDVLFENLKSGIHLYRYTIDETFFDVFSSHLKGSGSLFTVVLEINKQETLMQMDFDIKGAMKLTCDHCNEEADFNLSLKETLVVKFANETSEESADVKTIARNAGIFNVAQDIFDFIEINIPMRYIHGQDQEGQSNCGLELEKFLKKQQPKKSVGSGNTQWDELKKIKFDNK
ncbi:MAG TPA: DUF177 domain-containing protein [Bacteroidia bacterium]|nr:DUF177 domain-containing protein [Bacteroidia bacterium]HNT79542.1 DUF177 domain-containing protein [Bacteroidia bacterium]